MKQALAGTLLLSLTAACAFVPDLGEKPKMHDISGASSLSGDAANQWPTGDWWLRYNDPQLNALMAEALQNSPDMDEAAARLRRADAELGEAQAGWFPTLDAKAQLPKVKQSYNEGFPPEFVPKGFQPLPRATLNFNYEVDLWGRTRKAVAAASSEAEAAQLDAAQARIMVTTSVAAAYADLARLYAELDAADEAAGVRGKSADLFNQRFKNGLENQSGYDEAAAAQAQAEAEVESLKEQVALAKNGMAVLLGAGPDRAFTIARPSKQQIEPVGLPGNLPMNLLGRRPDIQALRLRTEALGDRIDVAETAFYPNVNLSAYIGQESLGTGDFFKRDSLLSSFGPAVSLPLFEGGRLRAEYKGARADYDASVAEYNGALNQALREVADAATSEKSLAVRTQKTQAALDAANRAYEVAHNRYTGGLATYLDVLRAEDTLIASRRDLADIKARGFTLDVAMVKALGGGFEMNSNQTNEK